VSAADNRLAKCECRIYAQCQKNAEHTENREVNKSGLSQRRVN